MKEKIIDGVPAMVGDLAVVTWDMQGSSWLGFKVYEPVGWQDDGTLLFLRDGWVSGDDHVTTFDQAEVAASGFIKWDGCNEWVILPGIHHCDSFGLVEFLTEATEIVAHLAGTHMPSFVQNGSRKG